MLWLKKGCFADDDDKEELPQRWKEPVIVPIYKKSG
jgi:hypothetical protein